MPSPDKKIEISSNEEEFLATLTPHQKETRETLITKMQAAAEALNRVDYEKYMQEIIELGYYLQTFQDIKVITDTLPRQFPLDPTAENVIPTGGKEMTREELKVRRTDLHNRKRDARQRLKEKESEHGLVSLERQLEKLEEEARAKEKEREQKVIWTAKKFFAEAEDLLRKEKEKASDEDIPLLPIARKNGTEDEQELLLEKVDINVEQEKSPSSEIASVKEQLEQARKKVAPLEEDLQKEIEQFKAIRKRLNMTHYQLSKKLRDILLNDYALARDVNGELNPYLSSTYEFERKVVIDNPAAMLAHLSVWRDDYLVADTEKGQLRAKAGWNMSDRRAFSLGFRALISVAQPEMQASERKNIAQYMEQADAAIRNYQNSRQKTFTTIGRKFAAVVATLSGLMTGVAMFSFLTLTVGLPALPAVILALTIFGFGTYVNWGAFKIFVPKMLSAFFGGDKLFQGVREFFNEFGERKQSYGGAFALIGSLVLAVGVGITFGAMCFSQVMALATTIGGTTLAISLFGVGTLAAIMPFVAVPLGIIMFVSMTCIMFKSFASMLQTESFKNLVAKLFSKVSTVFDKDAEANRHKSDARLVAEKILTYGILAVLSVVGFVGLAIASYAFSIQVSAFLTSMLSLSANIAAGISYGIGMGLAFVGQLPFIFDAISTTVSVIAVKIRDVVGISKREEPQAQEEPKYIERSLSGPPVETSKIWITLNAIGRFIKRASVGAFVGAKSLLGILALPLNALGNGVLAVPADMPPGEYGLADLLAPAKPVVNGLAIPTATANSFAFGCSAMEAPNASALQALEANKERRQQDYFEIANPQSRLSASMNDTIVHNNNAPVASKGLSSLFFKGMNVVYERHDAQQSAAPRAVAR